MSQCTRCKERPPYAHGLCSKCYQWSRKNAGPVDAVSGLMTPEQADERRRRIIAKMRAEGHTFEEINERFGGRGVRGGERVSEPDDMVGR
jgi:hypothetical protein